jgi:hypothetical protein
MNGSLETALVQSLITYCSVIGAATVLLAGCGGDSSADPKTVTPPANVTATTTPLPLPTPSADLLAPREVWLAAPAEPPPGCDISPTEQIPHRGGMHAVAVGPVYLDTGEIIKAKIRVRSRVLARAARDFLEKHQQPAAATAAWNRAIARAGQPGEDPAARTFRRRSKAVIRAR